MNEEWHFLWLNPEPWTSPNVATQRVAGGRVVPRVYKDEGLCVYQEAVKEMLDGRNMLIFDPGQKIALEFYFWRRLPDYTTDAQRRARKHEADATNLQKALEDALQGILFENDRDVVDIRSRIMEQGHDTEPLIAIKIRPAPEPPLVERPERAIADERRSEPRAMAHENIEELF